MAAIKRHAVLIYVTLTFALSWGAITVVVGPGGFGRATEIPSGKLGLIYLAMLIGPAGAGLAVAGIADGKAGLRTLAARMVRWRVDLRWYAPALLTAPVTLGVVALIPAARGAAFTPAIFATGDGRALLVSSLAIGVVVALFEEIGWTGFATPRLHRRHGILATGLVIGLIWGAWHFLLFWESDTFTGALPAAILLSRLFAWLPPYRVLMVRLYDRTKSGFLAVLMHASLVACQFLFMPAALTGANLLIWLLTWGGVLWILVALQLGAVRVRPVTGQRSPTSATTSHG